MSRNSSLALILACLSVAWPALAEDDHHDDDHHVSELDGVRVIHAWTRATSARTTEVFFDVQNRSDADVALTGGESGIAEMVSLVGFTMSGEGEGTYETLPSVPIKAGGTMKLAPNGLALQLGGLKQALRQGDEIEIEVIFDIGHMDVHVEVEAADATQHSHAGHNH
ncbi:copper chaperone PCu(A)C [Consotaella aegiceratis]|uniref:copper chaperone PCu(A)C n=1 Tax=Consotaella aegiceratis TaxID=3097961 RepID=UPI002F40AC8D